MILLAFALLAAGCAADPGGSTPDGVLERQVGPATSGTARAAEEGAASATDPESEDHEDGPAAATAADPATTVTLVPPTPADPPPTEAPMVGDLVVPCGRPGDGADVGIDDESIVIGVGNDRGGLHTAGSGYGVVEAVRALADHCNALGGIAGRQIVVDEFDAAVVEVEARMAEACEAVFAMVGNAYLADDLGQVVRAECGLPSFPAWTSGVADDAEGVVSSLTTTPLPVPLHGHFTALIGSPAEGTRVASVGPDTVGGRERRVRRAYALATSGVAFEVVADVGYGVESEPNWPDVVGAVRSAGAGVVHVDGSCRSALLPFLQAAAEAGWDPAVIVGPDAYDPDCISGATGVSFDRLLVEVPFLPAGDGPAAAALVDTAAILAELDVPVTGDTLRAASAFWLWAVAAESCGSSLDRVCLVEEGRAVDEWTAGGLHTVTDPGRPEMAPCAVLLRVTDGELRRLVPADAGVYDCEPLEL